jgi:hypothetical protein
MHNNIVKPIIILYNNSENANPTWWTRVFADLTSTRSLSEPRLRRYLGARDSKQELSIHAVVLKVSSFQLRGDTYDILVSILQHILWFDNRNPCRASQESTYRKHIMAKVLSGGLMIFPFISLEEVVSSSSQYASIYICCRNPVQ